MSVPKATAEDVRHAYRLLLGREPDEGGFASHLELLDRAAPTVTELARGFFGSSEFLQRFGCVVAIPDGDAPPRSAPLRCQACTRRQVESPAFLYWAGRLRERPGGLHRKLWEWCFIVQALYERGVLAPGRKGLGFAVGTEQLAAIFASLGCDVLATDLDRKSAREAGWVDTNQHAESLEQLNDKGLCSAEEFAARVRFRNVDMRDIPSDLRDYDFLWSSCALEHLGSLEHGVEFVERSLGCLRPGGVAVHTTELNCDSDVDTIQTGGSVIYRRRDLLRLADRLRALGHWIEPFDFDLGDTEADRHVDEPPYSGKPHLKLRIGPYASTSFGLIVTKSSSGERA
jgi:2-polyprenyl-3-methyl-5-hydroxy-6-metoxy-1,4-benzoquinol methylase